MPKPDALLLLGLALKCISPAVQAPRKAVQEHVFDS